MELKNLNQYDLIRGTLDWFQMMSFAVSRFIWKPNIRSSKNPRKYLFSYHLNLVLQSEDAFVNASWLTWMHAHRQGAHIQAHGYERDAR